MSSDKGEQEVGRGRRSGGSGGRQSGGRRESVRRRSGSSEGEDLGAVLDQLAGRRPWQSGMALGVLARNWSQVVGERLARESQPAGLEAGVLVVRASSQGWAAQIRFLAEEVRKRSEEVTGEGTVSGVRVFVRGDLATIR